MGSLVWGAEVLEARRAVGQHAPAGLLGKGRNACPGWWKWKRGWGRSRLNSLLILPQIWRNLVLKAELTRIFFMDYLYSNQEELSDLLFLLM